MSEDQQQVLSEICDEILRQLGPAHSEKVYQKAIQAEFNARSLFTMSEVCVPVEYETSAGQKICVGESYLDLWVMPWNVVIEVKHLNKAPSDLGQLEKYLDSITGRLSGFIVTFPKHNNAKVEIQPHSLL